MTGGDSSALTPQLGQTVVSGPKASALAERGMRRWAEAAGLTEVETVELLDMLGLGDE